MPSFLPLEPAVVRKTNQRRSWVLMAGFFLAAALEGYLAVLLGAPTIVIVILLVVAGAYVALGRQVLDDWMRHLFGATAVTAPEMLNTLEGIAKWAKFPAPALLMSVGDAPNGLALGAKKGWILLTAGSARLDRMELEAMFGQSLAHLRDGDASFASSAILLGSGPDLASKVLGSRLGWVALLSLPLFPAALAVRFLARLLVVDDREHRADVAGALLTRYPPGMVKMLRSAATEHSVSALRATDAYWMAPRTDALHMDLDRRASLVSEM